MGGQRLPRNVIGQPVRGDDLWNREKELEQIWKTLETSSVLLSAPRRFGKTSIMLSLIDEPKQGWQAHYLDVEWVKGPEDFVAEIMAALLADNMSKKILQGVKKIAGIAINQIEEVGIPQFKVSLRKRLEKDWQDKGKALIKLLKDVQEKRILIVDELPLLILKIAGKKGEEQAEDFLFWLRGLRHIPELQDKVRWVIGGSIGIEKVLQHVGTGTKVINDLSTIRIGEFPDEVADGFIRAVLKKEGEIKKVPPQVLERFRQIIGVSIPYFLQILIRESLNEMERRHEKDLSEEIIEQAYQDSVLACYNRTYFEHYYERIEGYYENLAEIAKEFLSRLAQRGSLSRKELWDIHMQITQGTGNEADFSYLLSDLENDFYVVHDAEGYTFATKVLRDWWRRYHAIF